MKERKCLCASLEFVVDSQDTAKDNKNEIQFAIRIGVAKTYRSAMYIETCPVRSH